MKRIFVAILIVVLLTGVAICCLSNLNGNFAYAESSDLASVDLKPIKGANGNVLGVSFVAGARTVYLYNITDENGKYVGARMSGDYFGDSDISVMVDVYSTNSLKIDFNLGESNLTDSQIAVRNTAVKLFSDISLMIDQVDVSANATYDGRTVDGHTYPTSDVYKYNSAKQGDRIEISEDTYNMLVLAREMYDETEGAFNPAVYRLVDLWGFSSRTFRRNGSLPYDRVWNNGSYPLPQEKYVEAFSKFDFTDFSQDAVTLKEEAGGYYVTKNVAPVVVDGERYEQWIDLGGIAKGYVVDMAQEMIAELGIDRFYVNAGRSSMSLGKEYDGGKTTLGLEDAFNTYSTLLQLELDKSSISTSGQNVRKYTVDGVEYAHIIDGVTGAPAQTGVRSVMVVLPQESRQFWATKGDCLTTALTVMGRDNILKFVNGYLKENGIKVIVQYETLDGKKQLLTNFEKEELHATSDSFNEFAWALKKDDNGVYYYDSNAKFDSQTNTYQWVLIVLGSVLGVGAVALVVYHFVRGKKRASTNVQNAKKDKPFKVLDVMVYIGVVLVILILFYVFIFDVDDTQIQVINVIDLETGETLFVYNVTRGEYLINDNSQSGWVVEVKPTSNGVEVTFTSEIGGKTRVNTMQIIRGRNPSVKMLEANCSGQDCVNNSATITRSGKGITCSPNRLKIVTE